MRKQSRSIGILTESAIMIALATVLSLVKIIQMPYGGSVTAASMLPIAIISYRHGLKWGLVTASIHGVIQQLLDLSMLNYFSDWVSFVAIILLDYIVAFSAAGLAGAFRKPIKGQASALCLGCFTVCLIRYACHVVSGFTVWAGFAIPTKASLIYSFSYNATYMIPETIVLLIITAYVGSTIDFRLKTPTRLKRGDTPEKLGWMLPTAGLAAVAATLVDTVLIFSKLQNAETGEFSFAGLASVNWTLVVSVTVPALLITVSLLAVYRVLGRRAAL